MLSPSDVMLPKLAACLTTPSAVPLPVQAPAVPGLPQHGAAAAALRVSVEPGVCTTTDRKVAGAVDPASDAAALLPFCDGPALQQQGPATPPAALAADAQDARGLEGVLPHRGEALEDVPCGRHAVPLLDSLPCAAAQSSRSSQADLASPCAANEAQRGECKGLAMEPAATTGALAGAKGPSLNGGSSLGAEEYEQTPPVQSADQSANAPVQAGGARATQLDMSDPRSLQGQPCQQELCKVVDGKELPIGG